MKDFDRHHLHTIWASYATSVVFLKRIFPPTAYTKSTNLIHLPFTSFVLCITTWTKFSGIKAIEVGGTFVEDEKSVVVSFEKPTSDSGTSIWNSLRLFHMSDKAASVISSNSIIYDFLLHLTSCVSRLAGKMKSRKSDEFSSY